MDTDLAAVTLTEAIYREHVTDPEWLAELVQNAQRVMPTASATTAGMFSLPASGGFELGHFCGPTLEVFKQMIAVTPPAVLHKVFAAGPVVRVTDRINANEPSWAMVRNQGYSEILGTVCRDVGARGVFLAFHLDRPCALTPIERRRLSRVSAHVATALRVRASESKVEAVPPGFRSPSFRLICTAR